MKKNEVNEILIKDTETLHLHLSGANSLAHCTIQNLNLADSGIDWHMVKIEETTFMGCQLLLEDELILRKRGAHVYLPQNHLPYNPYRHHLYTWQELMEGYDPDNDQSPDWKIYRHFEHCRFNPGINEALNQRIHDHSIDDAIRSLLQFQNDGMTKRKCVGFMGGHGTLRTDPFYHKAALTAKLMSENGFYVVSGGGPGIMEATNLGAYFAGRDHAALIDAIRILSEAPHYSDREFVARAREVLEKYPEGSESLAIPTWFYGHEPSNLFATHIAKYFSNSIREDTLLAISLYGVIYAPGSAGTTQEIFQDAAQNHYATYGWYSPMAFLSKKRYEIDTSLFPVLKQLSFGKPYHKLLFLSDEPAEIVEFILAHPPVKKENHA